MGKSSPSPPPAPDYVGAATAQGAANAETALATAQLSNPNIIGPYGSQTVQYGVGDNKYIPTITQTLTPAAMETLEAQQDVQMNLANLAQQGIGTAQSVLDQPFNYSGPNIQTSLGQQAPLNYGPEMGQYGTAGSVNAGAYGQAGSVGADQYGQAQGINAGAYGQAGGVNANQYGNLMSGADMSGVAAMPVNAGMTGQQAIMDRLAPQLTRQSAATQQQLANQGITSGSEAYRNAMIQEQQGQNDLLSQAALQGIGLDMGANQQGYGQAMGQANLYNQALGQGFGQASQAQQLQNQAIFQNFGQGLQGNAAINAAIAQNYGQGINSQQLQNQAISQNFGQGVTAQSQANAAMGQNYGQAGTSAGLFNQAVGQDYNMDLGSAQFGNTAAQQALTQELDFRNQPLNEIIGLMGGSQIQTPQFQGYTGANIAPPPIFGAAQAQGQGDMQNYGIQQAGANAQSAGMTGLLGSGMMAGAMLLSDRRLKSNIVKVGTHPLGIGIYEYDIFGERQRGVMADEVEKVMPEAVMTHESGYKMVNYGALNA